VAGRGWWHRPGLVHPGAGGGQGLVASRMTAVATVTCRNCRGEERVTIGRLGHGKTELRRA